MSEKLKLFLKVFFVEGPLGAARAWAAQAFWLAVALAYLAAHCLILAVVLWPFGLSEYCTIGLFTGIASLGYLADRPDVDRGTVLRDEKLGETITGAKPEE